MVRLASKLAKTGKLWDLPHNNIISKAKRIPCKKLNLDILVSVIPHFARNPLKNK